VKNAHVDFASLNTRAYALETLRRLNITKYDKFVLTIFLCLGAC